MLFGKNHTVELLTQENEELQERIKILQHREKLFESAFFNSLDGLFAHYFPKKEHDGILFQLERLSDDYNYFQEIEEMLKEADSSFSARLMELIREKNLDEVQVYKKADLDRRLFSKIRWNDQYRPTKDTAILLCMSMELSIDETEDLLKRAGMAFSSSSKADLIASYFITKKLYDIPLYKEVLFRYGLLNKF